MSSAITTTPERETRNAETITGPEKVQSFLDVLTDTDCRAILAATTTESLTARELSEEVGLPLSTTYRKLDLLTDAGALVERTRLDCDGSHPSEYRRAIDDVVVSVAADAGAKLTVTGRGRTEEFVLVGGQ